MPYYVTFEEAKKFALSKLSWIRAKLADSSACSPTVLRGGEGFVYFGRSYPLAIEEGTKYKFEFRDSVAVLKEPKDGNTDKRTAFMRKWFAKELEKRIEERLPYWESVCHDFEMGQLHLRQQDIGERIHSGETSGVSRLSSRARARTYRREEPRKSLLRSAREVLSRLEKGSQNIEILIFAIRLR